MRQMQGDGAVEHLADPVGHRALANSEHDQCRVMGHGKLCQLRSGSASPGLGLPVQVQACQLRSDLLEQFRGEVLKRFFAGIRVQRGAAHGAIVQFFQLVAGGIHVDAQQRGAQLGGKFCGGGQHMGINAIGNAEMIGRATMLPP